MKFVGYCLDNSEEIVPDRVRPSVLVIPGGGYEMTSDREAEPIAMQFLAAGFNAFVLRYSVKPSVFPVALLEAADAMKMIREHAAEWHVDPEAIAVIGFSAGGHLAANLATSASDDVLAAHGYDPDAVRPNGLMLAYPVITSGPLAHRGSFDSLLGERRNDTETLESVSIADAVISDPVCTSRISRLHQPAPCVCTTHKIGLKPGLCRHRTQVVQTAQHPRTDRIDRKSQVRG